MSDSEVLRTLLRDFSRDERALIFGSLIIRLLLVGFDIVGIALVGVTVSLLSSTHISPSTITGQLIRAVTNLGLPNPYAIFAATAVIFFVFKALAAISLNKAVLSRVAQLESQRASAMFRAVGRANLDELQGWTKKELSIALLDSLEMAFGKLAMSLSVVFGESLLILGIGVYLATVNIGLLCVVAIYFTGIAFVMNLAVANRTKKTALSMQQAGLRVNGAIFALHDNFRQVAALGRQDYFESQFSEGRKTLALGSANMSSMSVMPRYITEIALMLGFALLVLQRSVSEGAGLAASTIAIFVAGSFRIVASLLPLQGSYVLLKQIAAAGQMSINLANAVSSHMMNDVEALSTNDVEALSTVAKDSPLIQIKDLRYSYPSSDKVSLSINELVVGRGEFVVISGASGAGKSTLADILLGIRRPQQGRILVDGILPEHLVRSFPGKISYVPQSCAIFEGTIAENVSLQRNMDSVTKTGIHDALVMSGLATFVESLPDGIDTHIGEVSRNLSGGQVQRIGLARALFPNPDLLILDEVTSALDTATEASVVETLSGLKSQVTILAIAHRGGIFQLADSIYSVENGQFSKR